MGGGYSNLLAILFVRANPLALSGQSLDFEGSRRRLSVKNVH
jgi:hypothetical protein